MQSPAVLVSPEKWEDRLWSVSNAITGFALAQSLVAAYAFGKKDFTEGFTFVHSLFSLVALILITVGQIAAVQYCDLEARKLFSAPSDSQRLWKQLTLGRKIAITWFALGPFLGIVGTFSAKPNDDYPALPDVTAAAERLYMLRDRTGGHSTECEVVCMAHDEPSPNRRYNQVTDLRCQAVARRLRAGTSIEGLSSASGLTRGCRRPTAGHAAAEASGSCAWAAGA
jgi:hypothetical protein